MEKVQRIFKQTYRNYLKLKLKISSQDTELNEYGFDSISLTQFANKLNQEYKLELTPTIFFEYPTLHSFADTWLKNIREHSPD